MTLTNCDCGELRFRMLTLALYGCTVGDGEC